LALLLSDTLSGQRQPIPEGPIKLYVCGVTPYDTTHLGHAFTFVQFDALVRALRWLYPDREVTYVQNVTDVDDSILARARKLGVDWRKLGDEQTALYESDMRGLNVAPPTHFVQATSAMATIHDLIGRLVDSEAAYVVSGGSVFFRVAAVSTYGELSKLSREAMFDIASHQDEPDVDDPRKEDPLDFALWKGWTGDATEPCWPSPWGGGRPGWHIECSALCHQHLGPSVTLHGGGSDLIYPHHENEIAQSETATGVRPFVRIWAHTAMVRMDGEKMSKSLGNMVFVRDLLRSHSVDAVRLYLLSHHYRSVFEWSAADLAACSSLAGRLALAARSPDVCPPSAREAFAAALEDDLNTPRAISALESLAGAPLREFGAVLGLTFDA
jgi:L-cysteine:1D-myo-inositol 2-amino-2-deoxy-alpha-D-glucopyranoside ligase